MRERQTGNQIQKLAIELKEILKSKNAKKYKPQFDIYNRHETFTSLQIKFPFNINVRPLFTNHIIL